jgi:hypothetical protein
MPRGATDVRAGLADRMKDHLGAFGNLLLPTNLALDRINRRTPAATANRQGAGNDEQAPSKAANGHSSPPFQYIIRPIIIIMMIVLVIIAAESGFVQLKLGENRPQNPYQRKSRLLLSLR